MATFSAPPAFDQPLSFHVTRIFLTLAAAGTALIAVAFYLGLVIGDPAARDLAVQASVSKHMLVGLAGLVFAALVHAIVFTYFMGTGRWIEETSRAYRLTDERRERSQALKYRLLPGMIGGILLLVLTGALGGAADPASPVGFNGVLGLNASAVHLIVACLTVAANLAVHVHEFRSIKHNGELIAGILAEVRRIRTERGLTV